ncbi:site-2 protease family protein [Streptomyces sp. RB6PN25]|uniref:Zinc metalloprotease n=1 Tax=Streptomyces humicola TaxID=2953240 RepID=A0ABT1PQQ3_9ACTN|nr:site-2 protease family protein [Streptomyces humicola]MCQ4080001.1 site-2 protease family protein [Streptomyces humicola]
MNGSLPIGRLFGVPLKVHWSAPLLVALLGFGLGSQTLPALAPGHSRAAYTAAALLGAIALMLSLLLHEAAHAVIARRKGVDVEDMTLWALGGVTRMGQPTTPGAVLLISASGPLTSLLLGGLGIGAAFAVATGLHWTVVAAVLLWAGSANVLLGVFNLLPAAPLDGGRVLQAALWRHSGDRERAARAAGRSGQAVGVLLLFVGGIAFLRGSANGLWLMLIGFFITGSAGEEVRRAVLSSALRGVPVSQAMSSPVDTLPEWLTVARFFDDARSYRHSVLPLVDLDGRPTGIVTVRRLAMVPAGQREDVRVRELAIPLSRCAVAAPGDDLYEVLSRLSAPYAQRILVLDGSRLVGIVTARDISRITARRMLEERDGRRDGADPGGPWDQRDHRNPEAGPHTAR